MSRVCHTKLEGEQAFSGCGYGIDLWITVLEVAPTRDSIPVTAKTATVMQARMPCVHCLKGSSSSSFSAPGAASFSPRKLTTLSRDDEAVL